MKAKNIFLAGLFLCGMTNTVMAQATEDTNTITSGSYLGTANDFDVVFKRYGVPAGLISVGEVAFGNNAVAGSTGVAVGADASAGGSGVSIGAYAGGQSTNFGGVYVGEGAGAESTGETSVFIGYDSGWGNTAGMSVGVGYFAGYSMLGGVNVAIGATAGAGADGEYNVLMGTSAGMGLTGDRNIIIGHPAMNLEIDNQLIINNEGSESNPLIWGDFAANELKFNGKVGIGYGFGNYPDDADGVDTSGYNLFVKGGMLTEEVRINMESGWADYVFHKDYNLKPLSEVEQFINENGHLPNVPSACQIDEQGIELGNMAKIQQEKIEELTLYIIQQNKTNQAQNQLIHELTARLDALEKR